MMSDDICPCGSGNSYDQCCGPIIKKIAPAVGPEALMRSRYSAYVKGEIYWIRDSFEVSRRKAFDEKATQEWSETAEWLSLSIIQSKIDEEKGEGQVEFIAKYKQSGVVVEHHELSEFVRKNGSWFFTEGRMIKPEPVCKEQTAGRNDPCPCVSGKKYKKCCGA